MSTWFCERGLPRSGEVLGLAHAVHAFGFFALPVQSSCLLQGLAGLIHLVVIHLFAFARCCGCPLLRGSRLALGLATDVFRGSGLALGLLTHDRGRGVL